MKPLAAVLLAACALSTRAPAADPWPGEPAAEAVNLTAVDPGLNTNNWSGAFWNPETRTLWLACNFGYFWALVEDGAGSFQVATNAAGVPAKWIPGGDLEGICQAEYGKPLVFLMDENGWIREYDVSEFGAANETRTWDIRAECPEVDGLGPEGIAFLPDAWLAREGFTDTNGVPAASSNGMGGLMAVGHQSNGFVHVFDLGSAGGAYTYVGRYKTSRAETADLAFDRATGLLCIWHNIDGNILEIAALASQPEGTERRFATRAEYLGPRAGNLEGFALTPPTNGLRWCFLTDDNNPNGEAVAWYRQFRVPAVDGAPAADAEGARWTLDDLYAVLDTRTTNAPRRAGEFGEPNAGPTNGTMRTLNQIMALATNRAPVAKTGQTPALPSAAEPGADGDRQAGVAWPYPRFSPVGAYGTPETNQVRDNLTGLIWARDASNACGLAAAATNWSAALQACNGLTYGGASDWRMPNAGELGSLLALQYHNPPLCNAAGTGKWTPDNPFHGVQNQYYWTSSTCAQDTTEAWAVFLSRGHRVAYKKETQFLNVWPVRGGGQ